MSGNGPIRVPPLVPAKAAEYAGLFEKSGAVNGVLSGNTLIFRHGYVLTHFRRERKGDLREGAVTQRSARSHLEPLGHRAAWSSQRDRVHHRHAHARLIPDR
jgi:hypothetical protein